MARRGGDDIIAHGLGVGQRLAVDLGIGDNRGQIAGRPRATLLGEGREIAHHRVDRGEIQLGVVVLQAQPCVGARAEFRIGRAEHLLRQLQHQALVFCRQAKDFHDHQ